MAIIKLLTPNRRMTRILFVALLLGAFCRASWGVIFYAIDSPLDNTRIFRGSNYHRAHPELQPLRTEFNNLLQVRISPLRTLTNIVAAFGAELDNKPNDRARPLFAPKMIGESGLMPMDRPFSLYI